MIDYDTAYLRKFRSETDPLADEVIANIVENHGQQAISELFNSLTRNDDLDKVELPDAVRHYFLSTAALPSWCDMNKIKKGQEVFAEYGLQMSMLLLCKSLPEAYACADGAMVMYKTGRMVEQQGSLQFFTRRLMETAQFVVNVCEPGGLEPTGKGIITSQKVRLIHAAIRYYLKLKGWDAAQYGEPINQEDMAGTLQSFSSLILNGLAKTGVNLSEEEQESYYYIWHVVGHLIGLHDELNKPNYKEGFALGTAILKDQQRGSEQGKVLVDAVVSFMDTVLPGNVFDHAPAVLIRYFIGDEIADQLELPKHNDLISKITPRLVKFMGHETQRFDDRDKFIRWIFEKMNVLFLQGMLNYFNGDKGVHFYIPPSLRENWKLDIKWESVLGLTPAIGGYRVGVEKKTGNI